MADFSIDHWRYVKSIQVSSELVEEGLIELPLDREVLGHAAPGLSDLRVVRRGYRSSLPGSGGERAATAPVFCNQHPRPGTYTRSVFQLCR
jgi:hypothetical protein